jgi:hypothetical protein
MNVETRTYSDRIEVDVPAPAGLPSCLPGEVVDVGTEEDPKVVVRFTYGRYVPSYERDEDDALITDEEGQLVPIGEEEIDIEACAREAARLVDAAATSAAAIESEQLLEERTIAVKL